jgi:hypothetical protein
VGTVAPQSQLHVEGGAWLGSVRVSGAGAVMNFRDAEAQPNQKLYQWRSRGGKFRMGLLNDNDVTYARQNILVADASGKVGVGTERPGVALDVVVAEAGSARMLRVWNTDQTSPGSAAEFRAVAGNQAWAALTFGDGNAYRAQVLSSPAGDLQLKTSSSLATRMTILSNGDVGVGTQTPGAKLDVNAGSNTSVAIKATGAISATGAITGATVSATYQDVAEWVPSVQKLSPGTVVVLDAGRTSQSVLHLSAGKGPR